MSPPGFESPILRSQYPGMVPGSNEYVPMRLVLAVLFRRCTGWTRRAARRGIAGAEELLAREAA
jgi:hypothetical protein